MIKYPMPVVDVQMLVYIAVSNHIVIFLLLDAVDTKGNGAGQHIPFESVDPSDLDCSLCMRYPLFPCGCR